MDIQKFNMACAMDKLAALVADVKYSATREGIKAYKDVRLAYTNSGWDKPLKAPEWADGICDTASVVSCTQRERRTR